MTWSARLAAILLLLAPSLWLAASYPDLPLFGRFFDDGLYFSSAKGIAEGRGYRVMSLPEAPPQVKYPPLFPLVMASAWRAGHTLPEALRVASWLAWLAFPVLLAFVYLWLSTLRLTRWSIAGILVALSVNYQLLLQSRLVMTDLWGLDFLILALWAASRERLYLSGLASAAGFLVRVACLPLMAAIGGYFLYRRRFRQALQFGICAAPALLWWYARKALLSPRSTDGFSYAYSEYGDHFQPLQLLNNLPSFAASTGWLLLSGGPETWWKRFLLPLVAAIGIAGIVRMWKLFPSIRPYAVFGMIYSMIVLCWRFAPGPRFLLPLLPLLAAGIAFECEHLSRLARASWRKGDRGGPAIALGIFLFLGFVSLHAGAYGLVVTMPRDFAADRNLRERIAPFYEWARRNLEGSRVVTSYDGLLYLQTGVHGARIPDHLQMKEGERRGMDKILRDWSVYAVRNGYTHMVITEGDFGIEADPAQLALVDGFAKNVPELEVLYRSPSAVCYRFAGYKYSGINPTRASP